MTKTFTPKEKAEGVWVVTGQKTKFNRVWAKHRFTDEEVEKLLAGEEITIEAETKDGKPMQATGQLEAQEYNGYPFVGFKSDMGRRPPKSFGQYTFTDEEYQKLENGEKIYVTELVSGRTGNTYAATLSFDVDPDGDGKEKKMMLEFGD